MVGNTARLAGMANVWPKPKKHRDDAELARGFDERDEDNRSGAQRVGCQHDRATVEIVRDHSGKGREDRPREHLEDEDDAHQRGRAGHVVDQQRQRDLTDGFTEAGEEIPGPEIFELPVPQNLPVGERGHAFPFALQR